MYCVKKVEHSVEINSIIEIAINSPSRLKRFLRQWEKDEAEVEDIIGQALLNALRCIHTYSAEASIETWFFGVCKNTARRHVANKVRHAHVHLMEDFEEKLEHLMDTTDLSLHEELDRKETLEKVKERVARLPPDLQSVFKAVYIDGRAYREVADELSIPLGTLKSRVNRMRNSLLGSVGVPLWQAAEIPPSRQPHARSRHPH